MVKQGNMIGRVGKSGMATGPHLDFRVLKNDTFINPLTMKVANANPLPEEHKDLFFAAIKPLLAGLDTMDRSIMLVSTNGLIRVTQ